MSPLYFRFFGFVQEKVTIWDLVRLFEAVSCVLHLLPFVFFYLFFLETFHKRSPKSGLRRILSGNVVVNIDYHSKLNNAVNHQLPNFLSFPFGINKEPIQSHLPTPNSPRNPLDNAPKNPTKIR